MTCTTHHICDCNKARIEELEKEIEELKNEEQNTYASKCVYKAKSVYLEAQNEDFKKALEFYADPQMWDDGDNSPQTDLDAGDRAREVLEKHPKSLNK